jgi:hypothetical protein
MGVEFGAEVIENKCIRVNWVAGEIKHQRRTRKRVAGKRKRSGDGRHRHRGGANYVTTFYPDRTPALNNRLQYNEVRVQIYIEASGCERLDVSRRTQNEIKTEHKKKMVNCLKTASTFMRDKWL